MTNHIPKSSPAFINGMDLCEQFFHEIAEPLLTRYFPELQYSAGLLGYGSDVLGFDDTVSTDHMWGPRFYLFLDSSDISQKDHILLKFSEEFPCTYRGYSVNFSAPDPNDHGVKHPVFITQGKVSPLIFIHTPEDFFDSYLGTHRLDAISPVDWLTLSEHRLLALTAGKLFHDELNMEDKINKIRCYPDDVRLFLIASNWSLIAEEQAFVKRCSDVGDEIGSILVCSRISERLMRLAFLYCRRYAPYSKWFGRAFSQLPISEAIKTSIREAVTAADIAAREFHLVQAQKQMADLHNTLNITEPVNIKIENYFNRSIKVIFADKLAAATQKKLEGSPLQNSPLIGTLSEVSNFTTVSDKPEYQRNIRALYSPISSEK